MTKSELLWSDDFDGAGIDSSKWSFDLGTGAPELIGWGNDELQYYTERLENARIADGILVIEARKEFFSGRSYTSARLKTEHKGDWTYGRIEVRAKLPRGAGFWPAIWMMPTKPWAYGQVWAGSGEIDIMELRGAIPDEVYGTLHWEEWPNNQKRGTSFRLPSGDFSQDFHVFALEWDAGQFQWYVDEVAYQTQEFGKPFDKPFHLILNLAVGGNFVGPPDASTVFPAQMLVDYVRVYGRPRDQE